MHPCLAIPELVIRICSECEASSLARLGYTARLFDCALDILWSGWQDPDKRRPPIRLTRLLECFPREALNSDTLEPQHWERFDFYAKRVRSFSLSTRQIHPGFLPVLRSRTFPRGVLPNLKSLLLLLRHDDELVYARAFLSPQLEEFGFSLSTPQPLGVTVTSFLLNISTICLNTTKFALYIRGAAFNHSIPTLLENLRNLRQLSFREISTEHLPLIATLPNLTHLTLLSIMDSKAVLPSVPTALFEGLTDLKLSLSPKHFFAFFSLLSKCPLESIDIDIPEVRNAAEFAGFVHATIGKCQTLSLRRVSIGQCQVLLQWPSLDSDDSVVISGDLLEPFLHFPNITDFHCSLWYRLLLNDSFISALAANWPNLLRLHVDDHWLEDSLRGPRLYPTEVSAKSLASLAMHCPRLCFISLEFDATTNFVLPRDLGEDSEKVGAANLPSMPVTCNTSVHTLNVQYSTIGEPQAVAVYLRSLFPRLTSMTFSTPKGMEPVLEELHRERWNSVIDMVLQEKQGALSAEEVGL